MYKKMHNYIFALLPVIFSGFIYIFFRSEDILLFSWIRLFNIDYSLVRYNNIEHNTITLYIIYSLPNGLWVLSGLLLLKMVIKNNKKVLLLYSILFVAISIFIEIGQYFGIILGTFDVFDLITIIVFSIVGLIISLRGVK